MLPLVTMVTAQADTTLDINCGGVTNLYVGQKMTVILTASFKDGDVNSGIQGCPMGLFAQFTFGWTSRYVTSLRRASIRPIRSLYHVNRNPSAISSEILFSESYGNSRVVTIGIMCVLLATRACNV